MPDIETSVPQTHSETRSKQAMFLEALVVDGTVKGAAKIAGIHRDTHYDWAHKGPDYRDRAYAAQVAWAEKYGECILLETKARMLEYATRQATRARGRTPQP